MAEGSKVTPIRLSPNEPCLGFFPDVTPQTQFSNERGQGDSRVYNPARDIAYLIEYLLMNSFQRLAQDKQVHKLAEDLNVSDVQIADAMERYFNFITSASLDDVNKLPTFDEHVKETGIDEIEPRVRAYIGSVLGELTLMAGWQGKRSLTTYDHDGNPVVKAPDSDELRALLNRLQDRLSRPLFWRERIKAAWRVITKGR